ncbi:uncharacterized protein KZ484_007703 isoform 2-T2 [Pholidichthys leucotaenia]
MPRQGSTTRKCVVCLTELNVACKTCIKCKAPQPHKVRLKKKIERFDKKRESWVNTHMKNRTTSHIMDQAYMMLEKLQALGVRPVLFVSKPGRKPNTWASEVLAPRCQLTEASNFCLEQMKGLFDIVIQELKDECVEEGYKAPNTALKNKKKEMTRQGSTTKKCVFCHTQLNVACKTCIKCKAAQPRKLRLKRKIERFDKKRQSWVHTNLKNRTTSHIMDGAYVVLEKLHALGVRSVLFVSKPLRKGKAWVSEVLAPRCQLTETSSVCLEQMKNLFDVVIQGWTSLGGTEQPNSNGPQSQSCSATQDSHEAVSLPTPIAALGGPKTLKTSLQQRFQYLGEVDHPPVGFPPVSPDGLDEDASQQNDIKQEEEEQLLLNQERNSAVNQEQPEHPRMKEEQEELCSI